MNDKKPLKKSGSPSPTDSESEPRAVQRDTRKLGRLLIAGGLIQAHQLQEALDIQKKKGGKLAEILIRLGHLDVDTFAGFLASQNDVPSLDLSRYEPARELCGLIPRDCAIRYEVFPLDKLGQLLTVGMACPLDGAAILELEAITGLIVKGLLCGSEDIRAAIERYYAHHEDDHATKPPPTEKELRRAIQLENIPKLVQGIDALPTLPQTVQKVQQLAENPKTSPRDIAKVLASDPPISANLLRLANSAAFALSAPVDNIEHATIQLGLRETYMAVLSSAVVGLLEKSKRLSYKKLSKQSLFCAMAARNLANVSAPSLKPAAFMAGLLHNIGRFALAEVAPQRYVQVDQDLTGNALTEAEEKMMGIAYPEAGCLLACHWNFPEKITDALRFQRRPSEAPQSERIVALTALAAQMTEAYVLNTEPTEGLFDPQAFLLDSLNMKSTTALGIYTETLAATQELP